jgi:hypothetical protein
LTHSQNTSLRKAQQLPHSFLFYYGGTNDLATTRSKRQAEFRIPTFVIYNNFKEFKALQAHEPNIIIITSNSTDPTQEKVFSFVAL